jgi:hypothetical protein
VAYAEANCVARAFHRKARTGLRITQIARFQFVIAEGWMRLTGGAARSAPGCAQGQSRGMGEWEIVGALSRIEKGTRHNVLPLPELIVITIDMLKKVFRRCERKFVSGQFPCDK